MNHFFAPGVSRLTAKSRVEALKVELRYSKQNFLKAAYKSLLNDSEENIKPSENERWSSIRISNVEILYL